MVYSRVCGCICGLDPVFHIRATMGHAVMAMFRHRAMPGLSLAEMCSGPRPHGLMEAECVVWQSLDSVLCGR